MSLNRRPSRASCTECGKSNLVDWHVADDGVSIGMARCKCGFSGISLFSPRGITLEDAERFQEMFKESFGDPVSISHHLGA